MGEGLVVMASDASALSPLPLLPLQLFMDNDTKCPFPPLAVTIDSDTSAPYSPPPKQLSMYSDRNHCIDKFIHTRLEEVQSDSD